MLIDTHAHLCDANLSNNIESIREKYLNSGIGLVINVGCDIKTASLAVEQSKLYKEVYSSVGLHPECVNDLTVENLELIKNLSKDKKCLAIGEIGLDYHYEGYDREKQIELFERQILLAYNENLPIIVHSRDSAKDTVDILKSNKKYLDNGVLLHCFSESVEIAKELMNLNTYFAFGGSLTYKNSKRYEVLKTIPKTRLFAETDSPYLTPVPLRYNKELNEPKNVKLVYEFMANVLNDSVENLAEIFYSNFKSFFKKY